MKRFYPTAAARGLMSCEICTWLMAADQADEPSHCPRCGSETSLRKRNSLQRATALVIAAAVFYVPANMLPILKTNTLNYAGDDTILSGILGLWSSGSWPLALLVFLASMVVPVSKFVVLGFLIVSTHRRSPWALHDRTVLYRLIELIGRWSMLDVFVVTLMVALVQLRGVASIRPGAGALAFAAVVILTMYAVQAFDPRLMWDRAIE